MKVDDLFGLYFPDTCSVDLLQAMDIMPPPVPHSKEDKTRIQPPSTTNCNKRENEDSFVVPQKRRNISEGAGTTVVGAKRARDSEVTFLEVCTPY